MCRKLGIPMEFLPEICACDHVVGTVTEKAAEESGLAVGTPVVAGGLDAACGTLGLESIHPGETQEARRTGRRNEHLHGCVQGRSQTDPWLSRGSGTVAPSGRNHRRWWCHALV